MDRSVTMCAEVLEVGDGYLLVRNYSDNQEVIVRTPCFCRYSPNDSVRITYNGIMTLSLPPQINAMKIVKLN